MALAEATTFWSRAKPCGKGDVSTYCRLPSTVPRDHYSHKRECRARAEQCGFNAVCGITSVPRQLCSAISPFVDRLMRFIRLFMERFGMAKDTEGEIEIAISEAL